MKQAHKCLLSWVVLLTGSGFEPGTQEALRTCGRNLPRTPAPIYVREKKIPKHLLLFQTYRISKHFFKH